MFNSVGVICKPNDFTSQKTALELGVLLKDLGVNFLLDQEEFESEADLIIVERNLSYTTGSLPSELCTTGKR